MDPVVMLPVAVKYGAKALVAALGGSDALGGAVSEVLSALIAQESRIETRLDAIELGLGEVLEQRHNVELSVGSRFLLDALSTTGSTRDQDLQRARQHLALAASAARSDISRARAERHLLFCNLALGRFDLAPDGLAKLEGAALRAGLEAIARPYNADAVRAFVQLNNIDVRGWGGSDRWTAAAREVSAAAAELRPICLELLAESAQIAEQLGLPRRTVPNSYGTFWQVLLWPGATQIGPLVLEYGTIEAGNFAHYDPFRSLARFPLREDGQSRANALHIGAAPALETPLWVRTVFGSDPVAVKPDSSVAVSLARDWGDATIGRRIEGNVHGIHVLSAVG